MRSWWNLRRTSCSYSLKSIVASRCSNIFSCGWLYIKEFWLLYVIVINIYIFQLRLKDWIHVRLLHPSTSSHICSKISFRYFICLNTSTVRPTDLFSSSHRLLRSVHRHCVSKHFYCCIVSLILFLCVSTTNSSTYRTLSVWFCVCWSFN